LYLIFRYNVDIVRLSVITFAAISGRSLISKPYISHRKPPVTIIRYIGRDKSPVFFVLQLFTVWGRKAIVVAAAASSPIIVIQDIKHLFRRMLIYSAIFMPIEETIHRLKPSRIAFLKNYLLSVFLAVFVAYLFLAGFPIMQTGFMAAAVLVLIFLVLPEIEILRNTYAITSSQVIVEEGIISRKRRSVFFDNVADVSVHQNFLQRILRYGSVIVGSSSGRAHMELRLKGVQKPKELAYSIERLIKNYTGEKRGKKENAEMEAKKKE